MTEEELRHQSLIMAQGLETHGSVGILLNNAEYIYDYLMGQSDPPAASAESAAITFIEQLSLQHPIKGAVPFKLYDFQKKAVNYLDDSRLLMINYARQSGVTSTLAAYTLYKAATVPNQTILWTADKFNTALESMERMRYMANHANIAMTAYNKSYIEFENGSRIIAKALSANAGCGLAVDRLVIDNAAFVSHKKFEEAWDALRPAIGGGNVVIASTPNVPEGMFYKLWTFGGHPWRKLMLPWYEHPERDEEWAKVTRDGLDEKAFKREFCCSFVTDGKQPFAY